MNRHLAMGLLALCASACGSDDSSSPGAGGAAGTSNQGGSAGSGGSAGNTGGSAGNGGGTAGTAGSAGTAGGAARCAGEASTSCDVPAGGSSQCTEYWDLPEDQVRNQCSSFGGNVSSAPCASSYTLGCNFQLPNFCQTIWYGPDYSRSEVQNACSGGNGTLVER